MITSAKRKKSVIERFPEELHLIFHFINKAGSPRALTKCMQCCRRWYRIGVQLLYKDVALTNEIITRKFCRDIHLVNSNFRIFLRNLTLSLDTLPTSKHDHLTLLIRAVRYQSQLETLSLILTHESPSILRILQVLPQSVENLEIDFKYGYSYNAGFHLCDEIRKCLPHVKRLRLRLSHICKGIFSGKNDWQKSEAKAYRLRSITIVSWQSLWSCLNWCGSGKDDVFPLFTLYARACWLNGMFLECENFTVISVKSRTARGWNLLLQRYDVLRDQQSIFPMTYMHGSSRRYIDYYVVKVASKRLLYGKDYSLLPHVDDNSFSETNFGLRIPNLLAARTNHVLKRYQGQEVGDLREFRKKIWNNEEDMHNLMKTKVTHERPHFERFDRYHHERWELAAKLLDILRLHESRVD